MTKNEHQNPSEKKNKWLENMKQIYPWGVTRKPNFEQPSDENDGFQMFGRCPNWFAEAPNWFAEAPNHISVASGAGSRAKPARAKVTRGGGRFARKRTPAGETTEGERQPHTPFHPFQGSADIEDPLA